MMGNYLTKKKFSVYHRLKEVKCKLPSLSLTISLYIYIYSVCACKTSKNTFRVHIQNSKKVIFFPSFICICENLYKLVFREHF